MMNCTDCAKGECTNQAKSRGGDGCMDWEGIPCEPSQEYAKKAADLARKREDLEIWRQAYNAAIFVFLTVPYNLSPINREARVIANAALADYREKRGEMGL